MTKLAGLMGFSHTYLSRVEVRSLRPSLRYRAAVAKVLQFPEVVAFPEASR